MVIDPFVVLVGLLLGISLGLTGVGAGVVLTPFLILAMHVRPSVAVGTALVFSLVTKAAGSIQHLRQHSTDLWVVGWMAAASLPFGLASTLLVNYWLIPSGRLSDKLIAELLGGALFLAATVMTWRILTPAPAQPGAVRRGHLLAFGAFMGTVLAFTSVGSGSITLAGLALLTPLAIRRMVGTDIVHGLLLAAVTAPIYFVAGHTDMRLVTSLLIGSVPGVLLGSRLASTVPDKVTKTAVLVAVWGLALRFA